MLHRVYVADLDDPPGARDPSERDVDSRADLGEFQGLLGDGEGAVSACEVQRTGFDALSHEEILDSETDG